MTAEKTQTEDKKTRKRSKKTTSDATPVAAETSVVDETPVTDTHSIDDAPVSDDAFVDTTVQTDFSDNHDENDQPDVPQNERVHRYDVIITSERAGYKPPRAALAAMVQQIAFRGFATPVDEAIAETWTEVYFEPGPAAHEIFIEKEYPFSDHVFNELVLRVQDKPFFCEFSQTPKRPLYWAIEIRGSRYNTPFGSFKNLFLDALNLRITVDFEDAKPATPHKIVPENERPIEKKKHERGAGIVGTEVTEV